MTPKQKNDILSGGAALHKYQSGESLTDSEMVQARDFAELLATLSSAHPDCHVFRYYNGTAMQMDGFVRARAEDRKRQA